MDDTYRILVIGKSGNGRSTLCNALLGEKKFAVGRGMTTTTRTAQKETVVRGYRTISVIDTPDITNCNMNANEQRAEVAKWRELTRSDPAVVILTVRCDVRYTAEEYAIYKEINALWGGNSLKKKLIVAFTFADLQDNPLEEELKTVCPELRSVLRDCTDTWVRFSKDDHNERLVNEVMETAEQKSRPGGSGLRRPTLGIKNPLYLFLGLLVLFLVVNIILFIVFVVRGSNPGIIVCDCVFGVLLLLALVLLYFGRKQ